MYGLVEHLAQTPHRDGCSKYATTPFWTRSDCDKQPTTEMFVVAATYAKRAARVSLHVSPCVCSTNYYGCSRRRSCVSFVVDVPRGSVNRMSDARWSFAFHMMPEAGQLRSHERERKKQRNGNSLLVQQYCCTTYEQRFRLGGCYWMCSNHREHGIEAYGTCCPVVLTPVRHTKITASAATAVAVWQLTRRSCAKQVPKDKTNATHVSIVISVVSQPSTNNVQTVSWCEGIVIMSNAILLTTRCSGPEIQKHSKRSSCEAAGKVTECMKKLKQQQQQQQWQRGHLVKAETELVLRRR